MSETRMTDAQLSSWFNQTPEDVYAEARRARAAESTLAAQLAASQAECERLRSERDAAREALIATRRELRMCARQLERHGYTSHPDGSVMRALAAADAALPPPAPKGESTEAAKGAEAKRPKCLNCGDLRNVLDALNEVIPCPACNPPAKETP